MGWTKGGVGPGRGIWEVDIDKSEIKSFYKYQIIAILCVAVKKQIVLPVA